MKLAEICINRPVLATVISLVLIIVGLMGYEQLTLSDVPKTFNPNLTLQIQAAGSSAEFIENNAVTPLEERLLEIPNVTYMNSDSSQDYGEINLHFKDITPEEFLSAETQVTQTISAVTMPQAVSSVTLQEGRNSTQLMFAAVSSTTLNQHELVDYVKNTLVHELSEVPGVGSVNQDSTDNALRINLYPEKMAQYKLSVQQVIDAINNNDMAEPAGQIVNAQQAIPVNLRNRLESIDAFNKVVVAKENNHTIYLKDVAQVVIDSSSYAGAFTYFNGMEGVGLNIRATDGANPIAAGQALAQKIKELNRTMPPGTVIQDVYDNGQLIKSSVDEVFWTMFESIALVALVTLVFLGRPRFALIPIVTIPVCIIANFAVMWLLGFSLNLISLLALILAVGLVVDDAIVVLENCHRYIEEGLAPRQAALNSLKQITFPIIAMTISLFAVYLPSAFLTGKTAIYIQQFSFTLAGAVIISGVIALTLTPMMCARLLTEVKPKGYDAALSRFFQNLQSGYQRILSVVLNHRVYTVSIFVILLVCGVLLFKNLPTTLFPTEYAGYVFARIKAPDSASVAYVQSVEKPTLKTLLALPEVDDIMSFGGGDGSDSSRGMNFIKLNPAYTSASQTIKAANKMEELFSNVTKARIYVTPMDVGMGSDDQDDDQDEGTFNFYVMGNVGYEALSENIDKLAVVLRKSGMFDEVDNDVQFDSQQYQISIQRDLASQLNVPITAINTAISTLLGGYTINDGYQFNGINYPVVVQLPIAKLGDLSVLNAVFVNSDDGLQIPLMRVMHITPIVGLSSRYHVDGIRAGMITVTPKPSYTLGEVVNYMQQAAHVTLASNLSLGYTTQVRHLLEGNSTLNSLFIMGLIFIYLILAALYESFLDPFIILLTVPLCVVGAIALLKWTGGSLNLYTGVGLITLIGLVSKHGVLIVQFSNDLLKEKYSVKDAVLKAAAIRLRPILMTTATMVIGAVPLFFFSNIGSTGRMQLATVIIAGLLFGTFFSLFVVPVAYTIFKRVAR